MSNSDQIVYLKQLLIVYIYLLDVAKCRGHKIEREAYESDLKLMGNWRDRD